METNNSNDMEVGKDMNLNASLLQELEIFENADVGLRFLLNEETRQVVVCIIDRATQKVIKSIPQDKLINLQARDLLDMLA